MGGGVHLVDITVFSTEYLKPVLVLLWPLIYFKMMQYDKLKVSFNEKGLSE